MSRVKKKFAAAAVVAAAVPLVMVAAAGSASAASTITWKNAGNGLCLGYGINTFATDVATDPYLESCSAPGWTSVSWVDVSEGGGQWLEKPNVDQGLCMTAYYNHSVYFEACKNGGAGNSFERWREISSGGNWYLQNVATGEYLNGNTSKAWTSTYKQPWH
jgi:hypothetical protein